MKRHEYWRIQYRRNRYLRHLSVEELAERGRDTLNNPLTLNLNGKIGLLPMDEYGSEAMERFTHFLEECAIRNLNFQELMRGLRLKETTPDFTGDLGKRAADAFAKFKPRKRISLVKFGQPKYLKLLLNEGALRVQPASSFSNPKYNSAVGDDEIRRGFKLAITSEEIAAALKSQGYSPSAAVKDNPEIEISYFTDYWITCFSRVLQPRMSVDFEANAAIVIYDQSEFKWRLRQAFKRKAAFRRQGHGPVQYYDPYLPNVDFRAIPLIKPLKYYYQHEYRYYWLPLNPTKNLEHVDIEMGNLTDICDLVQW